MSRESFNVKGDPNVLAARYNQISTLLYWSRLAGSLNSQFPSPLEPLFQTESKCETFHM